MSAPTIRWMIRRDMPEVIAIESECFDFPWSQEDFTTALSQRNCIGMVAERDEKVVGYMIYEFEKFKLNILNLAVMPSYWRQGIGSAMLNKLIGKLRIERRNRITLKVSEDNLRGHLFFKKLGFRAISVLRSHYEHNKADAYQFVYKVRTLKENESENLQRVN